MQKSPEQWLEEVAPAKSQGILKLFLGYAPGVGKTYSMLSEAIRRASRGEEVVVGVVETHGRKATAELAAKLDAVPRRKLVYKGTIFEEMDVDAILARKPSVVVVDELAHTNIEGSKHRKRYEDVMELLDHNIDVLSTMNVQHVESLGPTIRQITGVEVRETVPDWVMQRVDEIVLADVTPEALQTRMMRGDIYPVERAGRALAHFFRPGNFIALRELALRQVRQRRRSQSRRLSGEGRHSRADVGARAILVCISSNPAAQYLIARGSRMAQGMKGELYVCYIDIGRQFAPGRPAVADREYSLRGESGREGCENQRQDRGGSGAEVVRENHITQVIFGRSARSGWSASSTCGHPGFSAQRAIGGCSHRDPGDRLINEHSHILVVDDEPQITRVLRTALTGQGYDIRVANDGERRWRSCESGRRIWSSPILACQQLDGVELCRRVRAVSQVPILVLSVRDQERQKIEALDAGADDYVTKPFSMNELVARVRANLRRTPKPEEPARVVEVGDFRIDLATRSVLVARRELKLTPKEFDLLLYLSQHPNESFPIAHCSPPSGVRTAPSSRSICASSLDNCARRLSPTEWLGYLLTERWVGYRFEPGA